MMIIWGIICCNILCRLLKMLEEIGIEGVLEWVGCSGVEILIE